MPMDMESSGSGEGSAILPLEITCQPFDIPIEIFTPLYVLLDSLQCSTPTYQPLLYTLQLGQRRETVAHYGVSDIFVVDFFERGANLVSITVCVQWEGEECHPDSFPVTLDFVVDVLPNSYRLFPSGYNSRGERSFRGVLDGAVPVYPPESVPFFSKYYRNIYVRLMYLCRLCEASYVATLH